MHTTLCPSFELENHHQGVVAGVDEVGYGAWAGPVMAAAVIIAKECDQKILDLLNDSKKIVPKKREAIFDTLYQSSHVSMAVGHSSVEEIDAMNIRQATLLAMKRALETLKRPPEIVLIDGISAPSPCLYTCYTHIKGDQRSYSMAAASIIAKVTRDRFMKNLSLSYPQFGWEKNVGYGTLHHRQALEIYGPTPWHRLSYKPIKALRSRQASPPCALMKPVHADENLVDAPRELQKVSI